jgi:hypothetical protein
MEAVIILEYFLIDPVTVLSWGRIILEKVVIA